MNASIMAAALAAALAMIAAPMIDAVAQSQKSTHQIGTRRHICCSIVRPLGSGAALTVASSDGWRLRSTARGWDNTCVNAP